MLLKLTIEGIYSPEQVLEKAGVPLEGVQSLKVILGRYKYASVKWLYLGWDDRFEFIEGYRIEVVYGERVPAPDPTPVTPPTGWPALEAYKRVMGIS